MRNPSNAAFIILAILAFSPLNDAYSLSLVPSSLRFSSTSTSQRPTLEVRASDGISPSLAAVGVGVSQYWDGIDGPWSSFALQAGGGQVSGKQDVRVFVSTAATAIWTIGAGGCPSSFGSECPTSRGWLFNPNESLTWTPNSDYETGLEMNLGEDTNGATGFDTATLGWQDNTPLSVNHTPIWNLEGDQYWLGVLGLNPRPTNFTNMDNPYPSFMHELYNNSIIPSLSYGYTAGNQYRLDKVFGSLTLGGYDLSRFTPNNVTFPFYEDISRDLTVYLQGITVTQTTSANLLPDGTISIFIDSTVPELWLPESACDAFETAFGIEYNTDFQRYLLNSTQRQTLLNQNASVMFTIGPDDGGGDTVDITFPYAAFDLQIEWPIIVDPNVSYYFPLRRAANSTQYTLGRTFLQEAYLIADYERGNFSVSACAWNQSTLDSQNLVTIYPLGALTHNSASFTTADIAGVAVGAAATLALVLAAVIFVLRRRKRASRRTAELEAKEAGGVGKTIDEHHESRPFISKPIGGELGGAERYEMGTPNKNIPQEMDSTHRSNPNKNGFSELEGGEYFDASVGEMHGSIPIYEMPGSNISELPTPEPRPSNK